MSIFPSSSSSPKFDLVYFISVLRQLDRGSGEESTKSNVVSFVEFRLWAKKPGTTSYEVGVNNPGTPAFTLPAENKSTQLVASSKLRMAIVIVR